MRAGLPVPEVLYGDWSAASGLEHGRTILAAEKRPAAVFAANDQRALGVMQAAHDRVPRIPEDLSVAGFADIDEGGTYGAALTTMHQNVVGSDGDDWSSRASRDAWHDTLVGGCTRHVVSGHTHSRTWLPATDEPVRTAHQWWPRYRSDVGRGRSMDRRRSVAR